MIEFQTPTTKAVAIPSASTMRDKMNEHIRQLDEIALKEIVKKINASVLTGFCYYTSPVSAAVEKQIKAAGYSFERSDSQQNGHYCIISWK